MFDIKIKRLKKPFNGFQYVCEVWRGGWFEFVGAYTATLEAANEYAKTAQLD